jgi:hypothetical protein
MLKDDGDIIRGLGLVTLYSAYLEEQIDNLCAMLGGIEEFGEDKLRWPISRKVKHAKKLLSKLDGPEITNLIINLNTCLALFEDRNELVHGRIYGGTFDRPHTLKSGRPNIPDREVDSAELYQLANEFYDFRTEIYRPMIFKIPRALNARS